MVTSVVGFEGGAEGAGLEQEDVASRARRPFVASLPDSETVLRLVRYETMLDRQIHRSLNELRRRRNATNPPTGKKVILPNKPS